MALNGVTAPAEPAGDAPDPVSFLDQVMDQGMMPLRSFG